MKRKPLERMALAVTVFFIFANGQLCASLPPEAQAAVDKGVIAAKEQEWEIAIRSLQDARKLAPNAPEIFYDLGLAESKIPGRELRAIAWFGAYLAADPNASNAAAVNSFITALQIKSQGNLNRLIKSLQDQTRQTSSNNQPDYLRQVAILWAEDQDLASALRVVNMIQDAGYKIRAYLDVAKAQTNGGDMAGAKNTLVSALNAADQIEDANGRCTAQTDIAGAQIEEGNIADAKETLAAALKSDSLIPDDAALAYKIPNRIEIANAQLRAGDISGAKSTIESVLNSFNESQYKDSSNYSILMPLAIAQAGAGDIPGALKTADMIEGLSFKISALEGIAHAQVKVGDGAGAKHTFALSKKIADSMPEVPTELGGNNKGLENVSINSDELEAVKTLVAEGDIADAQQIADSMQFYKSDAVSAIAQANEHAISANSVASGASTSSAPGPLFAASDRLNKLNDSSASDDCALNTDLFLDVAGYLSSQNSTNPQTLFGALKGTAEKIIKAETVIDQMLKQQPKQDVGKGVSPSQTSH
jgi:hypothetical protein